jgi:hypothetical protein
MRAHHDQITSGIFVANRTRLVALWKNLRGQLDRELSDLQQLQLVCGFWSHAPISRYVLNWDDPTGWPDPWSLMDRADFDESAVSLAMQYTLLLGADQRWTADRLQLVLATDPQRCLQQIMLVVDSRWLLNWEYLRVADWCEVRPNLHIHQRYSYNKRQHTMVERVSSQEKTS